MSLLNSITNRIIRQTVNSAVNTAVDRAAEKVVENAVNKTLSENASKTITFDTLPKSASELKALPNFSLTDPNFVAAAAIAALCVFPKDRDACIEMLNVLKGPQPLSNQEISFIRDRFMDGKDYVPMSYFAGAVPDNGYKPNEPYSITLEVQAHSLDSEGYIKLFVRSGGADSPRYAIMRNKPSTGEWFLWEFQGLLAGIRIPKELDPWA